LVVSALKSRPVVRLICGPAAPYSSAWSVGLIVALALAVAVTVGGVNVNGLLVGPQ
jgi:hypothetical protein